jgi:hypothetical protein
MHSRPRTQLLLQLNHEDQSCPLPSPLPELVQALSDLLLEALGGDANLAKPGQEASHEPQDHA